MIRMWVILAVFMLGLLIGCANSTEEGTGLDNQLATELLSPSPAPTIAGQPTATITLQVTITPRATHTQNPTVEISPTIEGSPLPTPMLPSWILEDFAFIESESTPNCILPCWQGLRIGESTKTDVQNTFDTVLGLYGAHYETLPIADYYGNFYNWPLPTNAGSVENFFSMTAWYETKTDILASLGFHWALYQENSLNRNMSAKRLLTELGKPREFYVGMSRSVINTEGSLGILMLYDQGVVYRVSSLYIDLIVENETVTYELCLDGETWNTGERFLILMDPLPNDLTDLTAIQRRYLPDTSLKPIEDVFSITLDEVMERLAIEENPCFSASEPD